MTTTTERSYLLRCLVGLLATGIIIGAIDLAACRVRTLTFNFILKPSRHVSSSSSRRNGR